MQVCESNAGRVPKVNRKASTESLYPLPGHMVAPLCVACHLASGDVAHLSHKNITSGGGKQVFSA